MARNMMKTIEQTKGSIPDHYDIVAPEIQELYSTINTGGADGKWDAITTAFRYGFVLGARAQKAGKFKVK